MNINNLFAHQKALDHKIIEEKGLQGKYLLKDKTVALICELYECIGENKHFKFWSENRKPNNYKSVAVDCGVCKGSGYISLGKGKRGIKKCDYCDGQGLVEHDYNPLLEEFADTLHFTLSIANDFGYHSHKYIETCGKDLNQLVLNITNIATVLPKSREKHHIITLVNLVIQLGYELGFTEEEVIAAYFAKNETNHERQANGY